MTGFSFEVPLKEAVTNSATEEKITSEDVEKKIAEQIEPEVPKKRGRKAGSTNKPKQDNTEMIKMFAPLVAGIHNGILHLLKLSTMTDSEAKMVGDTWGNLLAKKAPEFMEKYGDWLACGGASAMVLGSRLMNETKLFDFTKQKENKKDEETKQHNNDSRQEGVGQNSFI